MSCEARDRSPDSASCEAKIVLNHKTISASRRAKPRVYREAKAKAFCANRETTTASLILSALLGSARIAACVSTKALSAQIASSCKTDSTLFRVQPRLSREAKAKTLLGTNRVADSASLS